MLRKICEALKAGEITSLQLVTESLTRIREQDGRIHAFLEIYSDEALRLARESDERRSRSCPLSPLDGIPFAIKDNLLYQGHHSSCASRMLEGWVAPYTSTAVQRLMDAGMIPAGRTNMDEFAMGTRGENSAFGPVHNPLDQSRCAGGSSSGSAAAVAGGMVPFALGSDTGGSLRVPASWCGVTCAKPAWGGVSRWGLIAFASSLDCVGVLAPTAQDCALLMPFLSGPDGKDATCTDKLWRPEAELPRPLRIGVVEPCWEAPVNQAYTAARERFAMLGAELVPVSVTDPDAAVAAYYVISSAQASSNLARYDGLRYGHTSDAAAASTEEYYRASRGEGFGPEVKRRLMMGVHALTEEGLYLRANEVRTQVKEEYCRIFSACDFLLTPASAQMPPALHSDVDDPLTVYRSDALTVPASLAGLPSVCFPAKTAALPVGMCLTGPADSLASLLEAAALFES